MLTQIKETRRIFGNFIENSKVKWSKIKFKNICPYWEKLNDWNAITLIIGGEMNGTVGASWRSVSWQQVGLLWASPSVRSQWRVLGTGSWKPYNPVWMTGWPGASSLKVAWLSVRSQWIVHGTGSWKPYNPVPLRMTGWPGASSLRVALPMLDEVLASTVDGIVVRVVNFMKELGVPDRRCLHHELPRLTDATLHE